MKRANIFRYSGLISIWIYLVFTFISYVFYPKPFSPLTHWLSDLGDPYKNPIGRYFYNSGCMIISFLSIVFYIGLFQWRNKYKSRKASALVLWMQIAGIFSSIALFITANFPLGSYTTIHSIWSFLLYISLAVFELLFGIAVLKFPEAPKWTAYYGIIAMIINLITLGLTFADFYIGEWITVIMFYILIVIMTSQYHLYTSNDLLSNIKHQVYLPLKLK